MKRDVAAAERYCTHIPRDLDSGDLVARLLLLLLQILLTPPPPLDDGGRATGAVDGGDSGPAASEDFKYYYLPHHAVDEQVDQDPRIDTEEHFTFGDGGYVDVSEEVDESGTGQGDPDGDLQGGGSGGVYTEEDTHRVASINRRGVIRMDRVEESAEVSGRASAGKMTGGEGDADRGTGEGRVDSGRGQVRLERRLRKGWTERDARNRQRERELLAGSTGGGWRGEAWAGREAVRLVSRHLSRLQPLAVLLAVPSVRVCMMCVCKQDPNQILRLCHKLKHSRA